MLTRQRQLFEQSLRFCAPGFALAQTQMSLLQAVQVPIPAKSDSGRFAEDVDYIQDENGQWYKVGANTVTVEEDGTVTGAKEKVDAPPGGESTGGSNDAPGENERRRDRE